MTNVSTIQAIAKAALRHIKRAVSQPREFWFGLMLYLVLRPEWVYAGILSKGICKPYRQLVDNELFMVASAIAAVVLVIAWKLGAGNTAMSKGVGLLAALAIALNIENILQYATGQGAFC